VNDHPDIPVFITEGLKNMLHYLTAGYVAVAIVGVVQSAQEQLLRQRVCGFKVVLLISFFDADIVVKPSSTSFKRLG